MASTPEFAGMLQQVATLQADLSKAVGVCRDLRSENDGLVRNFEKLKNDHMLLLGKTSTLKDQYLQEVKLREGVENRYDDMCRNWKAQIDAKTEEFEAFQQQFQAPRDLDLLKLRIQEELEAPHKHKMHLLEQEADKFREIFYNVRRQHELLKTEYEQFTIDQGKREESLLEQHSIEVNGLREQVESLRRKLDERGGDDSLNRVRRELEGLQLRDSELKEEAEGLRRDKEAAKVELERAALLHGREVSELQARHHAQTAELQALEKKIEGADRAARHAEKERALSDKRYADMEAETARLKKQLDSRALASMEDAEDTRQREDAARDEAARRIEGLKEEVTLLKRRVEEAEEAKRRATGTAETLRSSTNAAVEAAGAELERTLADRDTEVAKLRARVQDLEGSAARAEMGRAELEARIDQEDVGLRGELRHLGREKESLEKKYTALHALHAQREAESESRTGDHQEVEEELARLQERHRQLLAREQALAAANTQLKETVSYLEDDIAGLAEQQEARRTAMIEEMEALRVELAAKAQEADQQKLGVAQDGQRACAVLQAALRKSKRKSDVYKKKAIKTHQREQLARQQLRQLAMHADAEHRRFEGELAQLRRDAVSRPSLEDSKESEMKRGTEKFSMLVDQQREQRQEMTRYLQRLDALG